MQIILSTTKLTEIFIECDDFIKGIEDYLNRQKLPSRDKRHEKPRQMSKSEMMTIIIFYPRGFGTGIIQVFVVLNGIIDK